MYENPVTYLVISTIELGGRDQSGEKLKMHICKTFNIIFRPLVVLVLRGDLECLVQAECWLEFRNGNTNTECLNRNGEHTEQLISTFGFIILSREALVGVR